MTFSGHTSNITSVNFHCETKWLATSSEDGTVKIWDVRVPSVQRNYEHNSPVNDAAIHPNQGELISCDQSGSVRIWDLGENQCTHELIPEDNVPTRSVTVASDGSMLVVGNNKGNVYVWGMVQQRDITALTPAIKFQAHTKYLTRALLSPDVKHLATCSADTVIKIWDTSISIPEMKAAGESGESLKLEKELKGHQRWVWDCAFSADSAYLVSASSDHIARLWELNSGETIRQYNGHHKAATCVALNDWTLA